MSGPKPTPAIDRLLARAVRQGDCLVVQNASHEDGYSLVYDRGKKRYGHRVSYEHFKGPIPDDLCVRHTCDNPPCIEPTHLVLGTLAQNNKDMWERGESPRSPHIDQCAHGHPYTEENTYRNSQGHRSCRICRRAVMRHQRAK